MTEVLYTIHQAISPSLSLLYVCIYMHIHPPQSLYLSICLPACLSISISLYCSIYLGMLIALQTPLILSYLILSYPVLPFPFVFSSFSALLRVTSK